jgi:hypothetical protein
MPKVRSTGLKKQAGPDRLEVIENPNFYPMQWMNPYDGKPAGEPQMVQHFYEGQVIVINGLAYIPKNKPHWAWHMRDRGYYFLSEDHEREVMSLL